MVCSLCSVVSDATLSYLVAGVEQEVCSGCTSKLVSPFARLFKVPSYNLPVLTTKFDKLARRAKKCGLPAPTFNDIRSERVVKKYRDDRSGELLEKVYLVHYITVDPGCSVVHVAGWTFIATVQHTEEGNIIRKVGECEIPTAYRTVSNLCEHCDTRRNRKDTYILRNELTGEYKQVGRNCLADFFGHDALMYAERASYISDISDLSESMEDELGFGGGGGPNYDVLESYLAHVAQCIKLDGWLSRGKARELGNADSATANVAYIHFNRRAAPLRYSFLYQTPEAECETIAQAAIEWAADIEGEEVSDYLHNIRTIAKRGVCEGRDRGMAASIVSAYQRHLSTLRYKEIQARRAEIAQHVGQVGERRVFKLNVEKVLQFERDGYGYNSGPSVVHLHIMGDSEGNVFTWWSSAGALPTGSDVVLKGTIKKHDERNGVKQNVLSRCEEVELKTYIVFVDGTRYSFEALSEQEVRKALRSKLSVKTLPRGLQIVVDVPEKVEGVDKEETFSIAV